MDYKAVRANCLDASALVKFYVEEDGSEILHRYFRDEATRYATPICFYEALNVLKVKWLYRKELSRDEYLTAAFSMTAWFSASSRGLRDVDFLSPFVFKDVRGIAERHGLDLSDAFQILSVKDGYFSRLAGDSRTVLITADEALAEAAKKEGVRAWYVLKEPHP